ncbi:MAG: IS1595 family transposase [Chitinophagaceae bacterium]|nr:IS1595 family transposase [Chitinophagaceae bacterium]
MTQLLEFKNLQELMTKLGDEQVCRAYMEQMRWGNEPFCPHCNSTKPYKLKDGKSYRCSSRKCKKDFTVTVGTIFENSKVKLSTWLAAIYILTGHKKGISSLQLSRFLGVTQKTAWFINHRVRLIMDLPPEPLDDVVEIDETYVGGKLANMSRGRRKKWQEANKDNKTAVMGLLQRDGKAKLEVIGNRTFKEVIRGNVHPTATIYTDAHSGYELLSHEYAGHEAVNHSIQEYRRGLAYTNSIEGFFSLFKRTIHGTYHYISPKHLHRYCAETTFRFNSRQIKDADRFKATISNVEGRLKYKNLISKA